MHRSPDWIFLRKSYMSLSYTWCKKYVFDDFRAFFVLFDHANAGASMHSLVKIHNIYQLNTGHPENVSLSLFLLWIGKRSKNIKNQNHPAYCLSSSHLLVKIHNICYMILIVYLLEPKQNSTDYIIWTFFHILKFDRL